MFSLRGCQTSKFEIYRSQKIENGIFKQRWLTMTEEVVYKKILRYTVIIIDLGRYLDRVVIKLEGLKIRRD
jgi:hypothetical protein